MTQDKTQTRRAITAVVTRVRRSAGAIIALVFVNTRRKDEFSFDICVSLGDINPSHSCHCASLGRRRPLTTSPDCIYAKEAHHG